MEMLEWKDIKGYENYKINKKGEIMNIKKNKVLKNQIGTRGYYQVKLKRKHQNIHRLVALTFLDNPKNLPLVNHKDGNILNNDLSNLEFCTASENIHRSKISKANISGFKGVCYCNSRKKWIATIGINGRTVNLGRFSTKEEAVKVREGKELELLGYLCKYS